MKRILPPTLAWICLIAMLVLRVAWPLAMLFPSPLHYLGILPLGLGFWLMMAAWSQFKRLGTQINTFARPGRLVTGGLYRFSRNPMYLGMALMLAGVWALLGALTPIVGVLAFVIVTDRGYIAFEEKALQVRFGQEYTAYRLGTRRWI